MKTIIIIKKNIDAVVLSHNHNDHTNGVSAILAENPNVPVYIHKQWEQGIPFQGIDIPEKNRVVTEHPGEQTGLPRNMLITKPLHSTDYGGILVY
jgi:metal-dependent hydrolase (beta-lactamase superfamily II)